MPWNFDEAGFAEVYELIGDDDLQPDCLGNAKCKVAEMKKAGHYRTGFLRCMDKLLFYHNIDNLIGYDNNFRNRFAFDPFVGMLVGKNRFFDVTCW
jgi:hypothetical protein